MSGAQGGSALEGLGISSCEVFPESLLLGFTGVRNYEQFGAEPSSGTGCFIDLSGWNIGTAGDAAQAGSAARASQECSLGRERSLSWQCSI